MRHLQEENKRLKAAVDRLVKHQLDEGALNARVSEVKRGLKAHGIADIVNGTHEQGRGCALAKVRPLVSKPTCRALRRHKAGGDVAQHGAFQLESKGTATCEVTSGRMGVQLRMNRRTRAEKAITACAVMVRRNSMPNPKTLISTFSLTVAPWRAVLNVVMAAASLVPVEGNQVTSECKPT